MARVKLSEFRAKTLFHDFLGIPYHGFEFDSKTDVSSLDSKKKYVVKVDAGVKKRFKQGLVKLDVGSDAVKSVISDFEKKGYSNFLVEEFQKHDKNDEKYLALERARDGILIYYSQKGGVDIEDASGSVKKALFRTNDDAKNIIQDLSIEIDDFLKFIDFFNKFYFSFLEINPLVVEKNSFKILDIASEVDSTAQFFIEGWDASDFRDYSKQEKTPEEKNVAALAANSQASLSLTILNPNGSIFMLLSGGGASIVLADEAYNQGKGEEVANYGEYSGNPSSEETYLYTKNILSLLLKSTAPKKALIVGGGVANFTDIRHTFKGVIQALDEFSGKLKKQNIKVFVRRGGPHQKEGLAMMRTFLQKESLFGSVHGPDVVLTAPVKEALDYVG
ncbi:MAG: hypothetical protein COU27_03150 [Candidatus Levybacteria bacterium CG10_big_fil_rev_8_21_14_0_10_36_7]|nr:MAG: hypothetical protein COU27_03150 [Candidatus Levybacteria bacterium CG10_big_fil_rev_8_21_14_0_10_36_7]